MGKFILKIGIAMTFQENHFSISIFLYMRWRMFDNFNVVSGLERGGWQVDLLAMNID